MSNHNNVVKNVISQLATLVPVPIKIEHCITDQPSTRALRKLEQESEDSPVNSEPVGSLFSDRKLKSR